ncbi:DEAD/DEAH box helicase family protein [Lederbergia galactosidilytica]|uniref:Helicase ATP-binding domain-containing protein n=1 Tax=Lederbergia galactosidilytica TaxID=217031 RepID=A0A178A6L7_9BACI|nr:DEAD/DEAH box helicase family protein [Lederbergia galactosidilytica]MBP1914658.1 superfamily II DNA or RNA helicase [Lederbergia galactosidilytica]OAK75835.1 hypothetical protein ABB05_00350 [Lederbergia galactosidilytica]
MNSFPKGIHFCYEWRSYQAKVLEKLEVLLKNKHLHLVAPPGSGKTVLGLEVMLRLNKPTFIIAPTIAIRNQWAERFVDLFLQNNQRPDWISTDINDPAFVTITTYQGLHSLFHKKPIEKELMKEADDEEEVHFIESSHEKEKIINRLMDLQFGTIILDEAHHLRTAWWQTTMEFRDRLIEPTTVALTATPPYDVGLTEWEKYIKLCGPIDAEIHVPELVREAELCPHQDYIYLSKPSAAEATPIQTFHQAVTVFQQELFRNKQFIKKVEQHPWIAKTNDYMGEILARPAYFSSMLIFLKAVGSDHWLEALRKLDWNGKKLPTLELEWLEELLTGALFHDAYFEKEEYISKIYKDLSRIGAVERRKVYLRSTTAIKRTLIHSTSKLASIDQIVSFEARNLKADLRLVILADYIHLQDLPKQVDDEAPLMRLGVIPIFEHLRRQLGNDLSLAVLTGSIVIVPVASLDILDKHAKKERLDYTTQTLSHDPHYAIVKWTTSSRQRMVSVLTKVFSEGGIQCLVGTTALLGEGWDAPSINALIIASYVGTFMLSNQIRGRAIRTEKENPHKTANIWHLACVDFGDLDGGHDFQSITRRFHSLIGLDTQKEKISTGIDRMNLLPPPFSQEGIEQQNKWTFSRAEKRKDLFMSWKKAVQVDGEKKEVVYLDAKNLPRPFIFKNTLASLLIIGLFVFTEIFHSVLVETSRTGHIQESFRLIIALSLGTIFATPFLYKAVKGFLRNPTIEKNMRQVAKVVYKTLYQIGLIETKIEDNEIRVEKDVKGHISCWLECGSTHEQKLFSQALQELIDPIENPRYLLFRQSGKRWWKKVDYHAIPEEIGRKKGHVEFFLSEWKKRIGSAKIIYTRTPEGRKSLLTARMKAMSAIFVKKSQRISEWR